MGIGVKKGQKIADVFYGPPLTYLLTYSIPHLLSQFFWPDLLLHMATKQDRDSSSLKTDASPEKTAPVSIIILQPPYYKT